jgi:hypothetical protein
MPARSPGYDTARRRLIALRYVRSDQPRIRVRIDPIVRRSLQILMGGLALILLSIVLAPPA